MSGAVEYCFNNPLTCTDPSGNSFFSKIFKFAVVAAVGYFVPIAAGSIFTSIAGTTGTLFATAASGGSLVFAIPSSLTAVGSLTSVAIGGFAAGTIASGNFKGGVQGAFTAGAFNLAGDFLNGSGAFSGGDYYGESGAVGIATHAVVGCVTSVTGGSKCGPGALSAAFSQAASRYKTDIVSGTIVSAVVGGTGSVLGGGKFTNGAETAAFGYLFNELLHEGSPVEAMTRSGYTLEGVNLPGVGDTYLDPRMATAVQGWMALAADQGVDIRFNSAFRISGEPVIGAVFTPAGDTSLHNAGLAVDIRYDRLTDISGGLSGDQQRSIIRSSATAAGLSWGGSFGDRVHFFIDPYGSPGPNRSSLIQTQQDAYRFLKKK